MLRAEGANGNDENGHAERRTGDIEERTHLDASGDAEPRAST